MQTGAGRQGSWAGCGGQVRLSWQVGTEQVGVAYERSRGPPCSTVNLDRVTAGSP